MVSKPHPIVELARRAVEAYIKDGEHLAVPPRTEWSPEMAERAGVFVSLHRQGDLRGCIGTFQPAYTDVAHEVIENAIHAATQDPRFFPLETDELEDLEISVDVLSPPEPIHSMAELDPEEYGVIVERGGRRGLLLPNLPQVTTAAAQVAIARQKASIGPNEPAQLYRFRVRRFY